MLHSILVHASNTWGKGLITKGNEGIWGSNGNGLYLDCGGYHRTVYICQNSLNCIL